MAEARNLLENPTSLLTDCLKDGLPGLESALKKLSFEAPEKYQAGIFMVSSYATAEFLQLIGIGAGFTSPDMQGFALAQINRKLDAIKAQINTMLGAPAIEAFEYLQRGILCVKARNNTNAIKEFNRVVKLSIKGRIYEEENLETVANLTKYLIFADIMINTYDGKKDYFVPYELLEHEEQKVLIKDQITLHLQKLLKTQEKQKSKVDSKWFSLPSSKSEKKEANQNIVDSIFKSSLQYVCPPGTPVPVNFIPDGKEDAVWLNLDGKPGRVDASTVYIYKEGSNVFIRHYSNNKKQEANIDYGHREELVLKANRSGLTIDNSTKEIKSSSADSTDLFDCSRSGHSELVSLLLQHPGVQVNESNQVGSTPQHVAAQEELVLEANHSGLTIDSGAVSLLLPQHPGVQVNERNLEGRTPLHVAAQEGHLDVASHLLAAGADVTAVDNDKSTPLHCAAWNGHLEVASQLLTAGADITAVTNGKSTPLHLAAEEGHLEVARLLVTAGANVKAVDYGGDTPAQLAKEEGHKDVVDYLDNV